MKVAAVAAAESWGHSREALGKHTHGPTNYCSSDRPPYLLAQVLEKDTAWKTIIDRVFSSRKM